jgi:hypothetical protein
MGPTLLPSRDERPAVEDDINRPGRAILLAQAALEYGPFVVVAALLVATSLSDEIPGLANIFPASRVGIYVCIAFVALLAFVLRLVNRTSDLANRVSLNTSIQERFIAAASRTTTQASLGEAFHMAGQVLGYSEKIRIFAITSKFISQHMQPREFSAKELRLLVSAAGPHADRLLDTEVLLSVVYTWVGRVRSGAIETLLVRQFDFYPTEWFAIFDDRLMIIGSYVYDKEAIGKTRTMPVAYVINADEDGRRLIESKIESFDSIFSAAATDFGEGKYEGTYRVIDDSVRRQSPGSDSWEELSPISQSALPLVGEA